jgi:hypothetical protein
MANRVVSGRGQGLATTGQIEGTDVVIGVVLDTTSATTIAVGAMLGDNAFDLAWS